MSSVMCDEHCTHVNPKCSSRVRCASGIMAVKQEILVCLLGVTKIAGVFRLNFLL